MKHDHPTAIPAWMLLIGKCLFQGLIQPTSFSTIIVTCLICPCFFVLFCFFVFWRGRGFLKDITNRKQFVYRTIIKMSFRLKGY